MKNRKKLLFVCLVTILLVSISSVALARPLPHIHTYFWNDWETKTPATCTTPGVEEKKCDAWGCNETITKTIDAYKHSWSNWKQTKTATCIEAGEETRNCTRKNCDATEKRATGLGAHSYGDWSPTKDPTCTEKGTKVRACTVVGCSETQSGSIDAKGHDWPLLPKIVKEPTCTEWGSMAYVCKRTGCNETLRPHIPVKPNGHNYKAWEVTTPATCTQRGIKTEKCTDCGDLGKKTQHIDKLPHDYVWVVTRAATCYQEGEETETCKNCPATRGTRAIDKLPHTLETNLQPSTCERKGLEHIYCTVPGCGYVKDTQLPELDHTFEWVVVTKPTLNKKGLDKEVCSVCGAESGNTRETDKLGDVYANNTLSLAGARVKDVNANATTKWYMIAPIDLTKDGVTKIDVVVGNQYIIGKLVATVKDGTVTFQLKMLPSVIMSKEAAFLTLYAGLDAIQSIEQNDVTVYELNKAYSIADDLAGAQKVYAYYYGKATYDRMADGVVYYVHNVKAANAILGK